MSRFDKTFPYRVNEKVLEKWPKCVKCVKFKLQLYGVSIMEVRNTTLDDISAIIGFTATIRLAAWFGDSNLYVPATVAEGQQLVALVGESAARRLSDEFGRQHVFVPSLHGPLREQRNALIRDRLLAGKGSREIATEIGLTERRVLQIRAEFERLGLIPLVLGKIAGKNSSENAPEKCP